jgi:hypothetical protein
LEGEVVMIVAMVAIDNIKEPGVFSWVLSVTAVFIRTDYCVNNFVRKISMRENLLLYRTGLAIYVWYNYWTDVYVHTSMFRGEIFCLQWVVIWATFVFLCVADYSERKENSCFELVIFS